FCDGAETCHAGACTPGPAPSCDDGNACTADRCDPQLDKCVSAAVPDGASCSDGDACDGKDTCEQGLCAAGTPLVCNDNNPCTAQLSDQASGCSETPVPDGASCSDGNVCSGDETCQPGTCPPGTPLVCNDNNPCTSDSCDPVSGCKATPLPDGASCSDGRFCDGAETCHAGACAPGPAPSCDDGNACTADRCDLQLDKCVSAAVPDGASCSDGDACNGTD